MRVCDIKGWPPTKYSAGKAKEDCPSDEPHELLVESVCFINGHAGSNDGDLVFVIRDMKTDEECTTRLKIHDAELGRKLAEALGTCKGMSLTQAGKLEIGH